MKTLTVLCLLLFPCTVFSQIQVRIDTICENIKIVEQRPAGAGKRLLHIRCKENKNDHFLLSTPNNGLWLLLNEKEKPTGRSRIISPKNAWLSENFRIRCNGREYDYNLHSHKWIKLNNPYDPKTSLGNQE